MISSLVGLPLGLSTKTSQCSKSQPSNNIISLEGRFDHVGGFGSLSDDDVAPVANPLNGAAKETRRRATPAAASGRRREREEIAEREEAAALEVAKERERKEARVRVLGRERERECIRDRIPEKRKNPREKGVQVLGVLFVLQWDIWTLGNDLSFGGENGTVFTLKKMK